MQHPEGGPDPPARVRLPPSGRQTLANSAQGQAHHKSESARTRQAGRGLHPKTLLAATGFPDMEVLILWLLHRMPLVF